MSSVFGSVPNFAGTTFKAHPGQLEIEQAIGKNFTSNTPASIVEIICSRGWGKTLWIVSNLLVPYMESHPRASVMWVAPTYQIGQTPIDDVFRGYNELTGERWVPEFDDKGVRIWEFITSKSGPVLKWWNGCTVTIKSADSPDSIVSKGFNLIIVDEAALVKERVFLQQIMGTARREGIKIFLITTPRGKNHFTYKLFMRGQDPTDQQVISFQQPFTRNPYFNETLKENMKSLPDWLMRQEYYAEFLDDGDTVFKGLHSVFHGEEITFPTSQQEWSIPLEDVRDESGKLIKSKEERRFVVGMDIAKSKDFTVITVIDLDTGELVYYRRMNKMDYRDVLQIASDVCHEYNSAELIFDATGVGSAVSDMLLNYDVTAIPFIFTNDSKNDIVNKLILSVEYQELRLPNLKPMKDELSVFTYEVTATGKISYNAPSGFHDDIVMSLALVNFYRKDNAGIAESKTLDEVSDWNAGVGADDSSRSWLDEMLNDND